MLICLLVLQHQRPNNGLPSNLLKTLQYMLAHNKFLNFYLIGWGCVVLKQTQGQVQPKRQPTQIDLKGKSGDDTK